MCKTRELKKIHTCDRESDDFSFVLMILPRGLVIEMRIEIIHQWIKEMKDFPVSLLSPANKSFGKTNELVTLSTILLYYYFVKSVMTS